MGATGRAESEAKRSAGAMAGSSPDRELLMERFYDAPRELVWKAWTEQKHIGQWFGPNGFRNETFSMDVRVGGSWSYVMHGPDGKVWPNWIRYEEISRPERLVYSHGETGSDEPHFQVILTLTEHGPRTKVTLRMIFPTAEAREAVKKFGAVEGGVQTMARLAGYLPYLMDGSADGGTVVTRLYDAPVAQVFQAWSSPAALARWWGPKDFTLAACELDFRTGGAYRMVMRGPDGADFPFHGQYREIVQNERIVFSAVIENLPGHDLLTSVTFVEEDGKTRLTVRQDRPTDPESAKSQFAGWSSTLEKLATALQAG
jgi:uncharacterized protein YndB with AHSA1/START domain